MTASPTDAPRIGWFAGDDELGLEQAVDAFVRRLEDAAGEPLQRWRARGDDVDSAALAEHVGTAPLFGGGTAVIVTGPRPLLRSEAGRDAVRGLLDAVAPGNALALVDVTETGGRPTAGVAALREAVASRGGEVVERRAPTEGRMAAWIDEQARARGLRLGGGAAQELARRVGAAVREGDVDRRRMSARAAAELDKLALYRPDGRVERDDVAALVGETVPPSTWALLDAVGERKARRAAELLDGLLETTPEPVILAQLHRRIRELIIAVDLLAAGATMAEIVKALEVKPYPAELRTRQARGWTIAELVAALDGLLDLDAAVKGADPSTPGQIALGFQLWVRDRVAPAGSR